MEDILKRIIYILLISLIFVALNADEEIISRRTFFSKTYNVEDNQYRTRLSCIPLHYLDEDGNFIEIDHNAANYDSLISLAKRQSTERDQTENPEYGSVLKLTGTGGTSPFYLFYESEEEYFEGPYYGKLLDYTTLFGMLEEEEYGGITNLQTATFRQINQFHFNYDDYHHEGCETIFGEFYLTVIEEEDMVDGCANFQYGDLLEFVQNEIVPVSIFGKTAEEAWDICGTTDCDYFTSEVHLYSGNGWSGQIGSFAFNYWLADATGRSGYLNISLVNDNNTFTWGCGPNTAEVYLDLCYRFETSVSGHVNYMPSPRPQIWIHSNNDTEFTCPDENGYYIYNYVECEQPLHVWIENGSYFYYEDYEFSWDEVTGPITGCDFTAIPTVSISGNFTNLHPSTPLEGLVLSFLDLDDENVLLNETTVAGDNTYSILVPSNCSGRLVPDASTFIIYPEDLTYTKLIYDEENQNFVAYLESQVSHISGNVILADGNGDITDVILHVADNSGPVIICNIDANGNYEFELTPVDYDGNPEFYLNFELMPLNGVDSDYYKVRREVTIDSGDDHTFDIIMESIDLNKVIINNDIMQNGFHDFVSVMDYLYDMNRSILPDLMSAEILIYSGTYNDELGIYNLQNAEITVTGSGSSIIDGDGLSDEHGIAFYNCENVDLTLDQLDICNWLEGGIVESSNSLTNCYLTIQNCHIYDNVRTTPTRGEYGAGIAVFSPSTITGNVISGNQAPLGGGGIFVSSTSGTTVIEDNLIEDNVSDIGAGIYLKSFSGWDHTVMFEVEGNTITGNHLNIDTAATTLAAAVFVEYTGNVTFMHNIVSDTPGLSEMTVACAFQHTNDLTCRNNTFTENTTVAASFWEFFYLDFRNNIVSENIFSYSEPYPVRINNGGTYPYLVRYNCLFGNTSNDFQPSIEANNTITEDPCLNNEYFPVWNANYLSSCIDTGDPDLDGDEYMWWEDDNDC